MKKLWTVFALSLLLLTGCSSEQKETSMDGESLYNRSCASCHGTDLKGISGPPLLNLSSKYSEEQVQKIIKDGVNMMPGKLLTDEESQIVTKWLMEK
ncbi:c-type cytochrome [Bacillus sp. 1NLA3E]|uniref:c-type cytochrome n=1 Tax=Bacillus sp. 1NLA3E TaxID=666686 RepID=UPI000247E98E|nr:cytochrome c [Bacillus sp. 1NLA3E]AGK55841.1 cytochrome c551 [Bacillus sp. 1NLA3E]